MKNFLKQVGAVIVGLLVVGVFTFVMGLVMIGAMVSSSDSKTPIGKGSVLHLKLNGSIVERVEENPLNAFLGGTVAESQGLEDMLKAIKVAATNENISGIYIEGGLTETDFASLEELRKAIKEFKKSGKFVMAYGETYTQGAYYVASAADEVLINPSGMLFWQGLSSQPVFYTKLLEKVGVKMQVFRVGTYKSYVEPFTLTSMSEANRAQVQSFISDIWGNLCKEVSASRRVTVDSLNAYADRYVSFADAAQYVKLKLVDRTAYADEVREQLRKKAGTDKLHLVSSAELARHYEEKADAEGEIAVYYAFGSIVGAEQSGFGNGAQIVGPKVVADLDKLANDDYVKAVVLRINSGGGSAYASEQMWRAIQQLKRKKPVVVSMGGMAASGGTIWPVALTISWPNLPRSPAASAYSAWCPMPPNSSPRSSALTSTWSKPMRLRTSAPWDEASMPARARPCRLMLTAATSSS